MSTDLAAAINQYGFPIIAAMGLGYFVYYVWKWVIICRINIENVLV